MFFLLQKLSEDHNMFVDQTILKDLLKNSKHDYEEIHFIDLKDPDGGLLWPSCFPERYRNAIPLGTIEFVNAYLNIFKNIDNMKPIEVPGCLRNQYFLKRNYGFYLGDNLPKCDYCFIKDASQLKGFSHIGNLSEIKDNINPEHIYQISDVLNIKSEYRVYIINGRIYSIANYNGDVCMLPDMQLIQNANMRYSIEKDYPGSYTMDVGVGDFGTCILECHVLFSCGLYTTVLGTDFLNGYIDGMNYLKKYNFEIKPDKSID
jgi:hypothetical protein